ncbi:MAG: hypothetical protein AB1815_12700, partial [Bacillota bacterium]
GDSGDSKKQQQSLFPRRDRPAAYFSPVRSFITELIRPKTPASVGGGFQRAVKSSMDSANIQRGLNPPLNEVSFKLTGILIHSG